MTSIPPLRPTETGSAEVEPAAVLRGSSPVWTAAAIAAAAAVFLAVVVLAGVGRLDTGVPGFLEDALGPEKAEAPMERMPATGVDVRIHDQGYTVSHWGVSVSVVSEDVGGAQWRRHVHGVARDTDFGTETIVVDGRKTEEFLTIVERQGEKTWRWKLATRLEPRLARDGAVTFLDPTRHLVTSIVIDPVRILDGDGNDVTPTGLGWGLEEADTGWWLTLALDDADLPLPYVIDPAVTHRTSATQNNGGGSTSLTITKPAGAVEKDLLVAHVSVRNSGTITAPAGWTQVVNAAYSFYHRQSVWYKVATASEPANYTWTFGTSGAAAGGLSAFYGVKTSTAPGPLHVADTTPQTANSGTVTATGITTTNANALVLALFTARNNTTFTQAAGMTELYEVGASGALAVATDSMIQVAAGTTGNKTSTLGASSRNSGTQVSFNVDDIAPSGSLTDPGTPLAGTVALGATASDADSTLSVQFQRSPANAGTWTNIGAADTTAPYSASFDTTAVPDGLYDLRVVVTDAAANVTNSTIVEDRRVDNTAPSSTTTFPASAGTYNTAGWNAGCGTIGFCGTYADAGSGVSQVQISVRQGSGNYWSGGSFSSATEVWNATTIAAGSWSFGFASASFPADGSYTMRVRATDVAGNVQTPSSRTFTIDRDEPQTTIDSNPAHPTASTSASFTFSSDEGGSTFQCRLDGGSWGACTSPQGYASLADGSHTFEVRATDASGNQDSSAASYTWLVDTTAPSSTTTFPAASGEYNTAGWAAGCAPVGFCGTYSDGSGSGVAQVQISVRQGSGNYWNGSAFSSGTEVWNSASLAAGSWSYAFAAGGFPADGNYTVRVRAVDTVANSESPSSRTFAYDTTSPSALLSFPASGGNYADTSWNAGCGTTGFCGTHSDALSGVQAVQVSVQRVSTGLYWDGSSFASASETFQAAGLAGGSWSLAFPASSFPVDGQYTVHVRARDDAQNTETGPSRTFRIDNTAPSSTVTFPASAGNYNVAGWDAGCTGPGLCGSHSDAGSGVQGVEVSIRQGGGNYWDGSGFTSASEVWNAASLAAGNWSLALPASSFPADGSYSVRVRASDAAGNGEAPSSRSFVFDSTEPETSIDSTMADPTSSTSASFDFSADEPGSTFECSIDGGPWSACTSPKGYTGLADGGHTFEVRATDVAGNTDGNPASFSWTVDTVAPTSTTSFPAASGSYTAAEWDAGCPPAGLCGTYSDTGVSVVDVEVSIRRGSGNYWDGADFASATEVWNDATFSGGDWSYDFDSSDFGADGAYTVRLRARDDAGNTEDASTRTFTFDGTAPSSTTAFPAASGAYNAAGWAAGCATAGLCGSYSDLTSGVAQVELSIRDGGGNYWDGSSFASASEVWNTATLAGGDWSYAFDSADFPADGSYTMRVRARDNAGNVETPATRTFAYDTTAPQTTIDSSPADPTGSTSADFDFSSSEGGSTFECRLDGGAWVACASPESYTSLADDSHTFQVRATDQAGNTDGSPASFTWLVDTSAPSSTMSFPAGGGEYNSAGWGAGCPTSGLCGTYGDGAGSGVAAVELSIRHGSGDYWDGSGFTSATEVWNDAALAAGTWSYAFDASNFPADGSYTVRVRATDDAGNGETPSSRSFAFDATNPAGALTAPGDGAALYGSSVTVASDSADGGSGVASAEFQRRPAGGGAWTTIDTDTSSPYSVSWNTTSLSDGDYDLRVITTDDAGNSFGSPVRTVTVDNSTPSTPVVTLSEASPFAHVSGVEIFVNTNEAGTYDVAATSSDAHSGIDKIRFPGPTDDSSSPYVATYGFAALSGSQTVIAFNGAGLTSSSPFTVTPDTAGPTGGSVTYPGGYDADGDIAIAVDPGTDALSGIATASAVLERRTAALSDGVCDPFGGGWNTVTSPDTVASGLCAQYRYRVSDRVGNEAAYTSTNVAKVDLASPSAPALTLDESSPYAHVVGTEIFLNTDETGSYDVQAATADPASGVAKVVFPGGVEDTSTPYAATYDFDDLLGAETVTAHDRAGNTSSSEFDVTEDVAAPSTSDDTASIGSAWQTSPVTVTLTPTDARSDVAATYYTSDGSVPTTSSDEGTSIDLTDDGVYIIRYFSVDNVGNVEPVRTAFATIRIDQANPSQPAITLGESSPFAHVSGAEIFVNTNETGSYDVAATSADAGSGLSKIVFPGGVEDTTSPYSASYDLDDLAGTQTVTAHDAAGLTAANTFTVTPDTAAPTGGSVDYPDGYDTDGIVTVTFDSGTDALSGVNAASGVLERRTSALVGGVCDPFVGGWSPVTSPDTVPDSTCARYRHRVFDRVGNEAVYTLPTRTVKVDLTAPQTTIDVAPPDPSSDASPSFEFSSNEPATTFECRLDGGAWAACSSPRSYAGLADGSHTFLVRATDAAGLTDATPASHAWTVDTAAPNTSFDDVPPDPSNDDTPTFEFSASEPASTFECRLDGSAWGSCPSPETIGLLADGSHTFEVRAVDAAGNVDGSPASRTWTVDTVAPDSSFSVVPADPSSDATPTFAFSANEPASTFQCQLDGGAWSACSSPVATGQLADGSHTFAVRATDAAGNQETAPESYTWMVDAGAPSVTIAQPGAFVNASDADPYTVEATSPDGDVASVEFFRCSDATTACAGGSWVSLGTDATVPFQASWPLDADGNRALRAVATDTAANMGTDVVDVTIDRSVPATAIDLAPSDPSASTSASFEFSASEGAVSFECRLDAASWAACASPQGYAGLTEGNHTFHVRATDAAGNVDPTPESTSWTVDTVAPQTVIDVAPSDPSGSPAPSFEFSSTEPASTFECRLDGGAWGPCSSPHGYTGLADGSHTFQVRATDAAGNVDGTPASRTWTIDATPPGGGLADPGQYLRGTVALIASPSDTGVGIQSVDFQVSPANAGTWTSIDVDTTDPYGVTWNTTSVTDGVYDLRIVVTDNAGNSSPSAVVEDRVVDNTAPGATLHDPGAYLSGTVSLTADATDATSGVATVAFQRSPAGAGAWTAASASWDTTGVADGLYDLRVTVTDNAGNSTTSAPVTDRRIDNTKPSLTASTPADGSTLAVAGSLEIVASEDVAGIVGAQIDGAAAPAPTISDNTVTYTHSFAPGPHLLEGELEDLAGNRRPIRVHFTTWSTVTADYPYVEKNSYAGSSMSLRSASDTATVTVPAGAWTGAPAGDWLVLRIDPQPGAGGSGGFQPVGEALDVTAYWALAEAPVTSFSLPLEIEIDNTQAHVIPAVFETGSWRPIAQVPGGGLPASWADGFEYDGTNVRIFSRHLSQFTLLEDVEAPAKPGGFKGTVSKGKFSLSWKAASDNSGPALRLSDLRQRHAREDGRRLQALCWDGQVQAHGPARVPGRGRGRGRQRRPEVRRPQGRPQGRQTDAGGCEGGAEEARLQDRHRHLQDLDHRAQREGHQGNGGWAPSRRLEDRLESLQGPRCLQPAADPRDDASDSSGCHDLSASRQPAAADPYAAGDSRTAGHDRDHACGGRCVRA